MACVKIEGVAKVVQTPRTGPKAEQLLQAIDVFWEVLEEFDFWRPILCCLLDTNRRRDSCVTASIKMTTYQKNDLGVRI